MDPKMPEIKSEVNKVDDDKKKSGLLGLLGGGGGGSAGGLGGFGAGAAGGGSVLGAGGLLATKAGMLALVLMGSAVAAGIGLAGYKMFGPGEADRTGGSLSLFVPKPQAPEAAAAPVNADGSSTSLGMMSQAAAKDKEPEPAAAPSSDPSDQTSASAAGDAAAAEAARREAAGRAGIGAINSGGGAGNVGMMAARKLTGTKTLGGLSSATGGGASSASASTTRLGDGAAGSGSRIGGSSNFSNGKGRVSGAGGRAATGGRGASARRELGMVRRDNQGGRANSSVGAGKTYDGSATNPGGAIGPDGNQIGMGGAGDGTGAAPRTIPANSSKDVNKFEPPEPKAKHMVTPWEKAVSRAMMLTMLAAGLAFAASKLPPAGYTKIIQFVIAGIIMAIGAYIGVLAGQIMSGPWGQPAQGQVVAAAALGVLITGVGVAIGANKTEKPDPKGATDALKAGKNGLDIMANPMVLLGGGLAIVAGIGMMLMPKPKPIELEDGQKAPDVAYHLKVDEVRYKI